jgi:isopenicillin N synthase-like dioxygenase
MNIFKTQSVRDPEQIARAIPVIDVGPAFRGEPGGLDAAAARVREASERVGFFYVSGHGVAQDLIDDTFSASREFHAMPLEDKLALKLNQNNIGYLPVNESIQRASTVHKATRPNFNESFFISHDRGPDHPDVVAGTPLRGANRWPAGHARMRSTMVRTSRRWRPSGSGSCR